MAASAKVEKPRVAKRIHERSTELYRSQFEIKHVDSNPVKAEQDQARSKSGKRVRSPWIADPFRSQFTII